MVNRMNDRCAYGGAVAIVKPTAGGNYDDLIEQEGLFHVISSGFAKGAIVDEMELIFCVTKVVQPYQQFDDYLAMATLPELRIIVSNTTESGIVFEEGDRPSDRPANSFPGKLLQFLKARFDHFEGALDKGFIVLPCELIERNGDVLEEILSRLAKEWYDDESFTTWISEANEFCNTLVDRIVPGAPEVSKVKEYEDRSGFRDRIMVTSEPYHIWVIEGPDSLKEEFPLEGAGINAVVTDDLSKYRLQKVRLLNGAHTSMVPIGILLRVPTVGQFIGDSHLSSFLSKLLREEVIPSISELDKDVLAAYTEDVLDRFRNPFVEHKLSSIALNSISKFTVRVFPSIEGFIKLNGDVPERLTLAMAALLRFYEGSWSGKSLPVQDSAENIQWFRQHWDGMTDLNALVLSILSDRRIWGRDLSEIDGFVERVASALSSIMNGNLSQEIRRLS
ncbi:UNVERIFIED_CONTAM: hypothetical protein GTU68_008343 [Idotea baltica]|nr:hypothetical protein [Idotea baltica]